MRRRFAYALLCLLVAGCSTLEPISGPIMELMEVESVDFMGTLWEPLMPPLSEGVASASMAP